MRSLRTAGFAASLLILALTGCEQPFNRRNFDLIKVGVDERPDVVRRIGNPLSSGGDSDEWYYEDQAVHNAALVHFGRGGKVSGKQWLEGDNSPFAGNPHAAPRDGTLGGDLKHVFGLD